MTFLETRFYIPFNTNLTTMHCRMLGSVFDIGTFCPLQIAHSSMPIPPQVPPAPGQPEGHQEDIPPPVWNVAGPQDLHHFDVAYRGVVDYHPQPHVGVSNSHPPAAEPAFDQ